MAAFTALFGLLLAGFVTGQIIDITPRQAVRRIGDELTVLCKVPYTIDSCRMTVGTTPYRLKPDNQDGDVVYAGQGLKYGECGAHIRNIKEEWNGNISCVLPPEDGSIEMTATMRLYVARAPAEPQLVVSDQLTYKEGDVFSAQCVVSNGRPVAKITWLLDDEVILVGAHQPVINTEPGTDLQTIRQSVSLPLEPNHGGKTVVCKVEHEALDQPRVAKRQLTVLYPPKRDEHDVGTITMFGLKVGSPGRLNVSVRANPAPIAEWTVGDLRLVAPQTDGAGVVTALEPLLLGNGYYNVSLLLAQITKEDVDRTYYLSVYNDLGREDFSVRLSTMDEPAGVELDTGAIVGIVVGVLVVLAAICLVVFALATDRWCFAGRSHRTDLPDGGDSEAPLPPHDDIKGSENPSHDHGRRDRTKNSGESSDTESAGGARSRLAGLGARVRAALPLGRDRVQATQDSSKEAEDKPLSEEKKGVVYAELQLGEQTATEKPPPPSTEYAEIVYTDQPAKETKE